MSTDNKFTAESMNKFGSASLPGFLGIEITSVGGGEVAARLEIKPHHLAPNGFLHAGTVITLADTAAAVSMAN